MKFLKMISSWFSYNNVKRTSSPRYTKVKQTKFGVIMLDTMTNSKVLLTNHHLITLK